MVVVGCSLKVPLYRSAAMDLSACACAQRAHAVCVAVVVALGNGIRALDAQWRKCVCVCALVRAHEDAAPSVTNETATDRACTATLAVYTPLYVLGIQSVLLTSKVPRPKPGIIKPLLIVSAGGGGDDDVAFDMVGGWRRLQMETRPI